MKKNIIKVGIIVLLALQCFMLLVMPMVTYAAVKNLKFDDTAVMDDLLSSTVNGEPFDVGDYPEKENGKPQILNVVEYCYTYKKADRGNFGLYLYVYNPGGKQFSSQRNYLQIADSYNAEGKPNGYTKFSLKLLSSSKAPYENLFYKFKVTDKRGADGKTIAERVNRDNRRYDISAVELLTDGQNNATEYTIGGTYSFTGFANGCGEKPDAESTLSCEIEKLNKIHIDLAGVTDGVDKRTYWRSNSSSEGENHQNQINSVFFAIDKSVLEEYGYQLQRIKAEWYEYKTRPSVVISDKAIYDALLKYNGKKITTDFDRKRGYMLGHILDETHSWGKESIHYGWSWNEELLFTPNLHYYSDDIETILPLLFYTGGKDVNNYVLPSESIFNYISDYTKSYHNGTLLFNGREFSADLFEKKVDDGRTIGYNLREFDIGDPNDYWNIKSYDDAHGWWDKLADYGFGNIMTTTNDSYLDVEPIQMVTAEDMVQEDLINNLKINESDIEQFKKFYDVNMHDKEIFIFRYALTDYFAADLVVHKLAENNANIEYKDIAEIRQGTQFFDFDLIEFTFKDNDTYRVIPVVSSPIDHFSDYSPSIEPPPFNLPDWLKVLLAILALIILLIILMPFLPFIFNLLIGVILLPFRLIGALFKAIGNAGKKKKE